MNKVIKTVTVLLMFFILCGMFTGCVDEEAALNSDLVSLRTEVAKLKAERDNLKKEIVDIKVENNIAKYVLTLSVKQSHFTLDLDQHLKDSMNKLEIQIPVDKEYFDSLEVGDTIADDFRMGSLIFCGSFGNWDITVKDKTIQ